MNSTSKNTKSINSDKKPTTRRTTDYHDFTDITTPEAERRKLDVGDIWINAAECKKCGDIVRSRNRHDFRSCKCGSIIVDGGSWYARRVGDLEAIKDIIVYYNDYNGK